MIQKGFEETARKDEMDKRFDEMDKKFVGTNAKIMKESQATRDHTAKVVAEASGEAIKREKILEKKSNEMVKVLRDKNMLDTHEAKTITDISPFHAPQTSA